LDDLLRQQQPEAAKTIEPKGGEMNQTKAYYEQEIAKNEKAIYELETNWKRWKSMPGEIPDEAG